MNKSQLFGLALLAIAAIGCSSGAVRGSESMSGPAGAAPASRQSDVSSTDVEVQASSDNVLKGAQAQRRGRTQAGEEQARPQLASQQLHRSVIRTAEITVRVDDVENSERVVNEMVRSWGGYMEKAGSNDLDSDHPSITISLRVPVEHFETAINKFEDLGVRVAKVVDSTDVTEQLVDIEARLKTMTAEEEVLRRMLQRANSLDESITLQQRMSSLRGEIESIAARRKTLSGLATLSTIQLTLTQSAEVTALAKTKDQSWLGESWAAASTSAMGTLKTVVGALIYLVLYAPIWIPLALIARWTWRKAYKSDQKPTYQV